MADTSSNGRGATGESFPGPVGRIGSPGGQEATSDCFYFWTGDDELVEKTQLVRAESRAGGQPAEFYGLVTEVYRRSRRQSMIEEADRFDTRPDEEIVLESKGVTYAQVRLLASRPTVFAPPREDAAVYPAGEEHAAVAYGFDEMASPLAIGLVRNGGSRNAGPAFVDTDYLLGSQGGHLNVTGIAGVGTKSSFLTIVLSQLLAWAEGRASESPNDPDRPEIRAVILNVKGVDLFYVTEYSRDFGAEDLELWRQMGRAEPRPMACDLFAPVDPRTGQAVAIGCPGRVDAYSWGLADVLEGDLFAYLFSDSDREDDNFQLMLAEIERLLVDEKRNGPEITRKMRSGVPQTFQELFDWFRRGLNDELPEDWARLQQGQHHVGTVRRFYRRLRRIVYESSGVFAYDQPKGRPLEVRQLTSGRPAVVDIASLRDRHLQRFVVAALLHQARDLQTGPNANRGMHYVFVLDELNRFAPRGHSDPITRLVEEVAAELRSRNVILLGAQQQASLVSPRVVENASVRVVGRTGGHELSQDVYSFLPGELRDYVEKQGPADKVVHMPSFREPMMVRVPRAPWAMRRQEATGTPPEVLAGVGAAPVRHGPRVVPRTDEVPF
jgi:uncharacterized protein